MVKQHLRVVGGEWIQNLGRYPGIETGDDLKGTDLQRSGFVCKITYIPSVV